jgi:alpha-tubulin suppressor-like RCC1 family protein
LDADGTNAKSFDTQSPGDAAGQDDAAAKSGLGADATLEASTDADAALDGPSGAEAGPDASAGCAIACTAPQLCWLGDCVSLTMKVAAGSNTTCALTSAGGVQCWGGELGNDSTGGSLVPVPVSNLSSGVMDLAVGNAHVCALTGGGAVLCWGDNSLGQLGIGGDAGTSGSLVPVGVLGLSSGVKAIGAGYDYTCALLVDGSVECWGNQNEVGSGAPPPWSPMTFQPMAVAGLSGVRAIAAGTFHTCVLTLDGGVACWGENTEGNYNYTTPYSNSAVPVPVGGLADVTAIAAGFDYTCAVTSAGAVLCWGDNSYGELGNNDSTIRNNPTPAPVVGLAGVTVLSTGTDSACALTDAGAVQCWGDNGFGQLGIGSDASSSFVPVQVSGLSSGVQAISTSGVNACAIVSGGNIKCWGLNSSGVLGNGSRDSSNAPVHVVEP